MTEAEAITFLQKCERRLGIRNLNAGQIITKSRNNCYAYFSLGFSVAFISLMNLHHGIFGAFSFYLQIFISAYGVFVIGLGAFMLIRLRAACRALGHAIDGSSRLSGTR